MGLMEKAHSQGYPIANSDRIRLLPPTSAVDGIVRFIPSKPLDISMSLKFSSFLKLHATPQSHITEAAENSAPRGRVEHSTHLLSRM
ncbi:hypothetical protein K1719_027093 [Acacia pycnantha]|nr:hypothetical protein K1719_027093 [Acacia pycnantha]